MLFKGIKTTDIVKFVWLSNMFTYTLKYCIFIFNLLFLPVHKPVPSFIYPASQLHTVVEQVACAGQLASVLAQDVAEPSAFTVSKFK